MGDALTSEAFAEIEFGDDFFVEAVEIGEPDNILEIEQLIRLGVM